MKRIACLLFLFIFLSTELSSKQWIAFFAKEGFFDGIFRQSFGHAYVALIREDPISKKKILVDCFGYYPKGGIQSEGFFGFMDGEMRDDVASMREHDFAVEITEEELFSCLILKRVWAEKKYSLRANNCIDFLKNYCQIISKLKVPEGFYLLPSTFLNNLRINNKSLESRSALIDVVEMNKDYKLSRFGFIKRQSHLLHEKFKKIKILGQHSKRKVSESNKKSD